MVRRGIWTWIRMAMASPTGRSLRRGRIHMTRPVSRRSPGWGSGRAGSVGRAHRGVEPAALRRSPGRPVARDRFGWARRARRRPSSVVGRSSCGLADQLPGRIDRGHSLRRFVGARQVRVILARQPPVGRPDDLVLGRRIDLEDSVGIERIRHRPVSCRCSEATRTGPQARPGWPDGTGSARRRGRRP